MDEYHIKLGKTIAQARKKAGLTQESLAFECELHPTYISHLERGKKSPTVRTLNILSNAMGTKAWEILKKTDKS